MSLATFTTAPGALLPSFAPTHSDEDFAGMASATKFLSRLQLFSGQSAACSDGKVPAGNYGLASGKDQVTPLGTEIDVLLVTWRFKALRTAGEIAASYDPKSAIFQEIHELAKAGVEGHMAGPEFLVWVPAVKEFATFLCGNKSGWFVAPDIKGLMAPPSGKGTGAATFKVAQKANVKKQKYHCVVATACSTPFAMPADADLLKVVEAFLHPEEKAKPATPTIEAPKSARPR